jgi:hypothetical protein
MFLADVWQEVRRPVVIIAGHLIVTVAAILSLAFVEFVLALLHYDRREIPFLGITLSDWLFDMDVVAASAIILIGILKGSLALWRH